MAVITLFIPSLLPASLPTQMELDASSRLQGLLTEAENQFPKQRGLGSYCGGHGFGTACPKLVQHDEIQAVLSAIKSHEILLLSALEAGTEELKTS